MRSPVAPTTRSPLNRYVPPAVPAGTLMLYVKAEKSPGATTDFVWVAYAVAESQPLAQLAFGDATLQVTLLASQTARFTCVPAPVTQLVVPLFAKNTENVPESPALSDRNALSNWYAESYPGVNAFAVPPPRLSATPSTSAAAVIAVVNRRIRPSFRVF